MIFINRCAQKRLHEVDAVVWSYLLQGGGPNAWRYSYAQTMTDCVSETERVVCQYVVQFPRQKD